MMECCLLNKEQNPRHANDSKVLQYPLVVLVLVLVWVVAEAPTAAAGLKWGVG
jgi:hypothetical protein